MSRVVVVSILRLSLLSHRHCTSVCLPLFLSRTAFHPQMLKPKTKPSFTNVGTGRAHRTVFLPLDTRLKSNMAYHRSMSGVKTLDHRRLADLLCVDLNQQRLMKEYLVAFVCASLCTLRELQKGIFTLGLHSNKRFSEKLEGFARVSNFPVMHRCLVPQTPASFCTEASRLSLILRAVQQWAARRPKWRQPRVQWRAKQDA